MDKEYFLCDTCENAEHKYISLCLAGTGYRCSKGHRNGLMNVPTRKSGCDDYKKRTDEIPIIREKRPNLIKRIRSYYKDKFI